MTKSVKEGTAHLVIIANDTSQKARERIEYLCDVFECKSVVYGTKAELGRFTGNREKSVICLTDEGFKKALLEKL